MAITNVEREDEVWKDIDGFYGNYQVSSLGRVKTIARAFFAGKTHNSFITLPGAFRKFHKKSDGYLACGLSLNGKEKKFTVHRLVAFAFIPNPENKECIDHINGIRDDNRVENLRWVTRKENMENPFTVQNMKNRNVGSQQVRKQKIAQLDIETGERIKLFNSGIAAGRSLGVGSSTILKVCCGRLKTAYGYKWQYATE